MLITEQDVPVSPAQTVSTAPMRKGVRASALRQELLALSDIVPASALVDVLIERGFELRATDIHLDPQGAVTRVRIRIDGVLHDVLEVSHELGVQMISRAKVLAGMDIAEKRLPQDGHFARIWARSQRDVRVATGPTTLGERVVLRLFPDRQYFRELADLGLDEDQASIARSFLDASYGMIVSIGPVGNGKTTTMYDFLNILNDASRSIATIEDPVEYNLDGVNQMQVDHRIGLDFGTGLRSLLRQDPNVIMVGEIRDSETAHIAVRAALTGTLVLSTLHASSAPGLLDVFLDHAVPSMLLADALIGVISQRLARKVCLECRESYQPHESERQLLGLEEGKTIYHAVGCDACFHTGYLGRTGVFEVVAVEDALRRAISSGSSRDMKEVADYLPLQEALARKVRAGITTTEEMHRVVASLPRSRKD